MRLLLALGLATYWLAHPGALHQLLHLGALVVHVLAHLSAQGGLVVPAFGSHWN